MGKQNVVKKFRYQRFFSTTLICLLMVACLGQFIENAKANFFPVPIPQPAFVIKSDGNVDPETAPIRRNGNLYTFTENIFGYTVAVERDNIVLDGNGYTLKGKGNSTGLFLKNVNGITVKNMEISGFQYGIWLFAEDFMSMKSSSNSLLNNLVTDNIYGIYISSSTNNTLRNNHVRNNTYNFCIKGSYYLSDTAEGYLNDVDSSNTVDGKPIIYWVNEHDKTVPSEAGYVALVNCTDITVQNLNLSNNAQGILIVNTSNVQVNQNRIYNSGSAIYLFNSTDIIITENALENSNEGIKGYISSYNHIASNNISRNKTGVTFTGISLNNTIAGNKITENVIDGLNLWGSANTALFGNIIAFNNETGINFFDSSNNNITANIIANNTGIGVKLWFDASENRIAENNITSNSIGILLKDAFDNTIIGNTIRDNTEWGIRFEDRQNNNVIYQNNFINNRPAGDELQVSVTGVGMLNPKPGGGNVWDNGTAGNFWSDYLARYPNATRLAGLGIGDTPFVINENNIDRYPLMEPLVISEFPLWTTILFISLVTLTLFATYRLKGCKKNCA